MSIHPDVKIIEAARVKAPSRLEVEKTILRFILLDSLSIESIITKLQPEDFSTPTNQSVYKAILELYHSSIYRTVKLQDLLRHIKFHYPESKVAIVGAIQDFLSTEDGVSEGSTIDTYITMLKAYNSPIVQNNSTESVSVRESNVGTGNIINPNIDIGSRDNIDTAALLEKTVLGAMLSDPEILNLGILDLRAEYFTLLAHSTIFNTILDIFDANGCVGKDVLACDLVRNHGIYDIPGDVDVYLGEMIDLSIEISRNLSPDEIYRHYYEYILKIKYEYENMLSDLGSVGGHSIATSGKLTELLIIAFLRSNPTISWRAYELACVKKPSFFSCGLCLPSGDIAFKLPSYTWSLLDGCCISTTDAVPEFVERDDVMSNTIKRLIEWCKGKSPEINSLVCDRIGGYVYNPQAFDKLFPDNELATACEAVPEYCGVMSGMNNNLKDLKERKE